MSQENKTIIDQIVVFTLSDLLYAIPLYAVIQVIHLLEIRYLPKAPYIISGVINVKGQIIPVVDVRKRFGLVSPELDPENQLILAVTGKRQIALLVDKVIGIKDISTQQLVDSKDILCFAEYIRGVAKIEGELILIYDLEQFLNIKEELELEQALAIN